MASAAHTRTMGLPSRALSPETAIAATPLPTMPPPTAPKRRRRREARRASSISLAFVSLKALDAAVGKYNQFVGSLESQVMVQARRFEDLAVDHEGREIPEIVPVEQAPRNLSRPELLESAKEPAE